MGDLFEHFERLDTCARVEVTIDNLDALARHFGGMAIYCVTKGGPWPTSKPRLAIPSKGGLADDAGFTYVEVGAWVSDAGQRWNPELLTQGWQVAGTWTRTDAPEAGERFADHYLRGGVTEREWHPAAGDEAGRE
jgi:hypothetical protein